ncbi:glycosyltransferase [Spirosoma humi]
MVSVTGQVNSLPMSPYLNRIKPWVSVICTSFNQQAYLEQALQSVIGQDYPNVELIVIDNGSTDGSAERIAEFIQPYPSIQFIRNRTNLGLNRAFNQGLALAGGRYVIDLSADDVLLPSRISKQVALFEELAGPYAVVFSNATYIDPAGRDLGTHYAVDANGRSLAAVPSGNVFRPILESYFICTPTMMMRRDVLNELGGYDETLAYEDFDFWVRSASLYQYAYLDDVLTLKRQCPGSMSAQVVLPDNTLLQSTLTVCHKAYDRCSTPEEYGALARRIRTFIRKAFYAEQFDLALKFGALLRHIERPGFYSSLILELSRFHLPVNKMYQQYLKFYPVSQSAKLV